MFLMKKTTHIGSRQRLLLYIFAILAFYTILDRPNVIKCLPLDGNRCLHQPPTLENVNYSWLADANFTIEAANDSRTSAGQSEILDNGTSKTKRQINDGRYESSQRGSTRSTSAKKKMLPLAGKDELVPMKIQVFYDDSVALLEPQKQNLITKYIMPNVTKFFESVLSIKRDYAIDKFRISRRCPNNTVYYARNPGGTSRPYCMNRCEDYAICGEIVVPPSHLAGCSYCNSTTKLCITNNTSEMRGDTGLQLLLYVSAKQTARCQKDQTIAYAAHCAQDTKTDRPVAGHANLCPNSISTDAKELKSLIATVKHELTHVLGFSVSLFAYYRDQTGRPYLERDTVPGPIPVDPVTGYAKWSDKVIRRVTRTDWLTGAGRVDKQVHLVVTPTVVREVRAHFNCPSLEGAELEDQGSDGTSLTHWEKRLFENEAMTGTHTQNSIYSRLTLAILQDTGWYVANLSRAERLEWGRDLGCDFAQKSCKSWIESRRAAGLSIKPFCDRPKAELLQISCTDDRSSKAVCNMKFYKEPLPEAYRNFDQLDGVASDALAYLGGSVDLADYCPFIQEFTWQAHDVSIRGSRCDLGTNSLESERNPSLEYYGPQTRCFEHGRRWEQRSCLIKRHWHHYGAGCYRFSCSDGHLKVRVGNHTYTCYYPDQVLHIEQLRDQWLFNGTIICPACDQLCPARSCKSYDKQFIDKIFATASTSRAAKHELGETTSTTDNHLTDVNNSIETHSPELAKSKASAQKLSLLLAAFNGSHDTISTYEPTRIKQFLIDHELEPKHQLVCSGSSNLQINTVYMVGLSMLIATRYLLDWLPRNQESQLFMI